MLTQSDPGGEQHQEPPPTGKDCLCHTNIFFVYFLVRKVCLPIPCNVTHSLSFEEKSGFKPRELPKETDASKT